jgi:hypothetical protein
MRPGRRGPGAVSSLLSFQVKSRYIRPRGTRKRKVARGPTQFQPRSGLCRPRHPSCRTRPAPAAYPGPNVILVRFGGGVRRAETIEEAGTYAPYLRHVLAAARCLRARHADFATRRRRHEPCGRNAEPSDRPLPRLSRRRIGVSAGPARTDRTDTVRIPARGLRRALAPGASDQRRGPAAGRVLHLRRLGALRHRLPLRDAEPASLQALQIRAHPRGGDRR